MWASNPGDTSWTASARWLAFARVTVEATQEEKISFDCVMTPEELRAWFRYHAAPTSWTRSYLPGCGLIIAGIVILSMGVMSGAAVLSVGAVYSVFVVRAQVVFSRQTRRSLHRPRPAVRTWEFSTVGVRTRSGRDQQAVPWTRFTRIDHWRQFVVFRARDKHQDVLIPRRAFPSPGSIDTVRRLAGGRLMTSGSLSG